MNMPLHLIPNSLFQHQLNSFGNWISRLSSKLCQAIRNMAVWTYAFRQRHWS